MTDQIENKKKLTVLERVVQSLPLGGVEKTRYQHLSLAELDNEKLHRVWHSSTEGIIVVERDDVWESDRFS